MPQNPSTPNGSAAASPRPRALWWWAAAGVVVLIVVVLVLTFGQGPSSPTGAGTATATTSPAPQPTASIPSDLPVLPPAAPDQPAPTQDGVGVRITTMESVEGKAVLPGEVAGPAVRYTIQIDNEGSDPLDLTFTTVTAFLGDAMSPALQLTQPDGAPFAGVLQPGQSAAGVYIFRVPTDQRSDVTVNVAYRVGSPAAVFQGAAPAA